MTFPIGNSGLRAILLVSAAALAGCDGDISFGRFSNPGPQDQQSVYVPPEPDSQGVITYHSYQVAIAERGDTVAAMARRFGQDVDEMASLNGIHPETTLRAGEVIVLPRGVGGADIVEGRIVGGQVRRPGEVDIETIANDAIERADPPPRAKPRDRGRTLNEPYRYRVKAGDTASGIAREFDVSVRALADWNGLGPDNKVRVGQSLLIPPPNAQVAPVTRPAEEPPKVAKPGQGSQVTQPPSASKPPPKDEPAATSPVEKPKPVEKPANAGGSLMLPVNGAIIREFEKGTSDGIDISAAAGSPVVAAGAGTVAAITLDAEGVAILVIRHADGLLTVYAGIDQIGVERGQTVKRGQKVAVVRDGGVLHFETRRGFESVDPAQFLN